MYRCLDCDAIFSEPREIREHVGDFWGVPAYEEYSCCPNCGGDYEKYDPNKAEEVKEDAAEEDQSISHGKSE